METKSSSIKSAAIAVFLSGIILALTPFTESYAARGCCSRHGGVASCDTSTGFLKCKDGTKSPTCKCSGEKVKPTKQKQKQKPTTTTTQPVPAPVLQAPATTAGTTTKPASTKGCCKGHHGVASCDTATGRYKCKDGTISPTCQCH